MHPGIDRFLSFPREGILKLVAVRPHVGADLDEVTPHLQLPEKAKKMPGHSVPGVAGTQPDSDVIVVRDIEDDPPVPAAVLHRSQTKQTEQLPDRNDGRLAPRVSQWSLAAL